MGSCTKYSLDLYTYTGAFSGYNIWYMNNNRYKSSSNFQESWIRDNQWSDEGIYKWYPSIYSIFGKSIDHHYFYYCYFGGWFRQIHPWEKARHSIYIYRIAIKWSFALEKQRLMDNLMQPTYNRQPPQKLRSLWESPHWWEGIVTYYKLFQPT